MKTIILLLCVFNGFMRTDDRLGTTLNTVKSDLNSKTIAHTWAGMAVSKKNRLFVNFPRTESEADLSIGEILDGGKMVPFPNRGWNDVNSARNSERRFFNVQDLFLDHRDVLWALDSGNSQDGSIEEGSAKLVEINIITGKVENIYLFNSDVVHAGSHLEDVEIDLEKGVAIITDSGTDATLILNLGNGHIDRLSYGHYAVLSGINSSRG